MENLLNPNDLISQVEAAEIRGVTRASINELVKRGRLKSVTVGGKVLLYRSEVEGFEPDKGGRPPKQSNAASQKYGTLASQTKTTRKLPEAFKQAVDERMNSPKKRGKK